ncbi:uncharacterized protein STEHIDRAFT_139426 [Stereum hirsutum FP-91666 SS1]|uniref:uncharacterized protein n=1 Tax=Stereum hirsutum (strain FP-91666) TaxID=721885 RepID=UPI000440CB8F|nr:uncharacterized protein STEHIDRAFT_139426 [Stereum hirsutum FP-91666 SS1]EIM86590.1 hypothetical protein STEHIDRAFT_139426 [Stereum hirsutum FP-91666 SS1]
MASTFSTWTQSSNSNVDFKTGFLAPPPTPVRIKTNTRTARVYNGRTHRSQAHPHHGHTRTAQLPPPPIPVPIPIRANNRTGHAHYGQTRNTPTAAPPSTKVKKATNPSALTTSSTSTNDTSDTTKTTTSIVSRASSAISAMTFRAVAWLSEGVRICIILYIAMFFMSLFFMVFSYVTPDRTPIGSGGMLDASNPNSSFTGNSNSLGSTGTNASVTGSPYDPPMNLDPTSEARHTTDFTPYDPIITTTVFIVIAVSPILLGLGWMVYDAIFGGFERTRALWVNVRAGWRWKIDGRWWRYGRLGEKADGEGDGEEGQGAGAGAGMRGWGRGRGREKGGDEESVTYSYTRDQSRDWNV